MPKCNVNSQFLPNFTIIHFGDRVGHRGWLIGAKIIDLKLTWLGHLLIFASLFSQAFVKRSSHLQTSLDWEEENLPSLRAGGSRRKRPRNKRPRNKKPRRKRPRNKRPRNKRPRNKTPRNKRPRNKRPRRKRPVQNTSVASGCKKCVDQCRSNQLKRCSIFKCDVFTLCAHDCKKDWKVERLEECK